MFQSDAQASRAIQVVLDQLLVGKDLWTADGPTPYAVELHEAGGGPLSSGERVLLLAAFALWNGSAKLAFRDVLSLDPERRSALATLLIAEAQGPQSVDRWIETWRARGKSTPA